MSIKIRKQRSSGRGYPERIFTRDARTIEALCREILWLNSEATDADVISEACLRQILGNEFADYVEVTPAKKKETVGISEWVPGDGAV